MRRVLSQQARLMMTRRNVFTTQQHKFLPSTTSSSTSSRLFHTTGVNRSVLDEGDKAVVFQCRNCGHQEAHAFSKEAFEKGVVTLICSECNTNHCVADHVGFYADPRNTADLLAKLTTHSAKKFEKKIDLSPLELQEMGLYEKVVERKKEADAAAAANTTTTTTTAEQKK